MPDETDEKIKALLDEMRYRTQQCVAVLTGTPLDDVPSDAWLVRLLFQYPQSRPDAIQELLACRDWKTGESKQIKEWP